VRVLDDSLKSLKVITNMRDFILSVIEYMHYIDILRRFSIAKAPYLSHLIAISKN